MKPIPKTILPYPVKQVSVCGFELGDIKCIIRSTNGIARHIIAVGWCSLN